MSCPPFRALFGRAPTVTASAPGRVNLIGEHTDYNGGFVLPLAIPQRTTVELAPRADDAVRAATATLGGGVEAYALGAERPGRGWLDYLQGLTQAVRAAGFVVRGCELRIDSAVPVGSGLSSSAALEVAVLRALRQAFGLTLDDVALARLGQRAENDFVGARVGIMDQMACSLAEERSALYLDTRSLAYERVPLPAAVEVVVIDSGVPHDHARGDYNVRRGECERACALLGVGALRDVAVADVPRVAAALPEPLGRRVHHVVHENARVSAAASALRTGNLVQLGTLLGASHRSLRDDYEVSVPALDLLVELAGAEPDVLGARLTGGGFGGAIVALARAGTGAAAAARVAARYAAHTGQRASVLVPVGATAA